MIELEKGNRIVAVADKRRSVIRFGSLLQRVRDGWYSVDFVVDEDFSEDVRRRTKSPRCVPNKLDSFLVQRLGCGYVIEELQSIVSP